MTMRDATNDSLLKRVISPQSVADNTPLVGQIIDRRGFRALTYNILIGSVADADATFTTLLEEGDDAALGDAQAVADADMISQTPGQPNGITGVVSGGVAPEAAASFKFDSDDQVRKLGYIGAKRYTRLTITPAANGGAALIAASAELEHADIQPVVQTAS